MAAPLKLIYFSEKPWADRWSVLKQILKEKFNVDLNAEIQQTDSEKFAGVLAEAMKTDAEIIRASDSLAPLVPRNIQVTTHEANFIGASGLLLREKGQWWTRPVLDEAFTRTISENVGQIDINSAALVAGAGGAARAVVSSLARMGFPTVNISDMSADAALELVFEMKRKYFKVHFTAIPYEQITTLPGIHSVMINTTWLAYENVLLDELYFFNFLKPGGVVVDLTLIPWKTPLISEAEKWGARHLSGDYFTAERDALMISKLRGIKIPVGEYRERLRALIDTVPFDSSPYLKRFRDRGT
jgi:shikimate 5-dehydrogenase